MINTFEDEPNWHGGRFNIEDKDSGILLVLALVGSGMIVAGLARLARLAG